MAKLKKPSPKYAVVACSGGCRATADCQYGCVGCGVCVTKCPKDVRKMVDGDRVLFCKPLKKSLVRERNVRRQPKKN